MDQQNQQANTAGIPQPASAAPQQPPVATPNPAPAMPTEQPAAPVPPATTPLPGTPATPGAAAPQTGAPQPATPAKKSSKFLIILIVILVLACAGVAAYFMLMPKQTAEYEAEMTSVVTPTVVVPSPTLGPVESGDAELDEQSTMIDENMEKLESDVQGVNNGLNDKADTLQ